jgi:Tfp pilus assembly protein PilV
MFTLDVQPPLLSMAAVRQQLAAQRLTAIAAELESAGSAASAAAGEPGLASAISTCCSDGAATVHAMNITVGGLATNLEGASGLYTTDQSAMPGG